jgi:hypothetical protein
LAYLSAYRVYCALARRGKTSGAIFGAYSRERDALASRRDSSWNSYSPQLFAPSIERANWGLGDGKLESEVLPLEETILVMEIMDRVREIGGLKYPEHIEKV